MYFCCGITDAGPSCHNEDAFLIRKTVVTEGSFEQYVKSPFFAAVCDGVAGEMCGELASRLCLEQLKSCRTSAFDAEAFQKHIDSIHNKLRRYGSKHRDAANMQTTLCALHISSENQISFINVGDSRLYRFRGNQLRQLSRDQSLVQLLYEEGGLAHEQRRRSNHRHIVMPVMGCMGNVPKPEIKLIDEPFQYGDVFLLCTDGLSDKLLDADIESVLVLPESLPERLRRLTRLSIESGGTDNVTCVAVTIIPDK